MFFCSALLSDAQDKIKKNGLSLLSSQLGSTRIILQTHLSQQERPSRSIIRWLGKVQLEAESDTGGDYYIYLISSVSSLRVNSITHKSKSSE